MKRVLDQGWVGRLISLRSRQGRKMRRGAAIRAAFLIVPFFASGAGAEEVFLQQLGSFDASLSLGYVSLGLPAVEFTTRNSYDTGSVVSMQTNFSDHLGGQSLAFELSGPLGNVGDMPVKTVISGFYGAASGSQDTSCTPDDITAYCYWPVIQDDPSIPQGIYNYFSDEIAQIHTKRDADVWGLSLGVEAALPNLNGVSLKGGADFRHIGVDTSLDISCPSVECDADGVTSQYREDLTTTYVGAFVGLDSTIRLSTDTSLNLAGQVGLYSAHTDYSGLETQTYPGFPDDVYDLKLSRQHLGVIGAVQAELNQRIGAATLTLFTNLEWYSWAPKMKYNNNDQTLDPPGPEGSWTGTQVGTEIGNGNAWSNIWGLKLTWVF